MKESYTAARMQQPTETCNMMNKMEEINDWTYMCLAIKGITEARGLLLIPLISRMVNAEILELL